MGKTTSLNLGPTPDKLILGYWIGPLWRLGMTPWKLFLILGCWCWAVWFAPLAKSQEPVRYRWQKDQTIRYLVEHRTKATESMGEAKNEIENSIRLVREWKVLEVDEKGQGRLQMRLISLKSETKKPDGEVFLFDSEKPDDSNPQLRDQLSKFVGQPLAVLIVDPFGKVVQILENKGGSVSRFDTDPPFGIVISDKPIKTGDTWERKVAINPNPNLPIAEGLKPEARLVSTCVAATSSTITIRQKGEFTKQPENPMDRIPLLQFFPDTEVVIDTLGLPPKLIVSKIDRTLKYGEKEGSSYRLVSDYRESRVDD